MRWFPLPGWLFFIFTGVFVATWVFSPGRSFSGTVGIVAPSGRVDAGALRHESVVTEEMALPPGAEPRGDDDPPRSGKGYHSPGAVFGMPEPFLVSFTFDDGPHRFRTAKLLKILRNHDIRAAFFVNGYWMAGDSVRAKGNREVLRRAVAEGHLVGNHTLGHARLPRLSDQDQARQIVDNHRAIVQVAGVTPRLFRPPYGAMTAAAATVLAKHGYTEVLWNATAPDQETTDVDLIRRRVMFWIRAHRGGIVMLHDRLNHSVEATALILRDLDRLNCRRLRRGQPTYTTVDAEILLDPDNTTLARRRALAAHRARHLTRLKALCTPGPKR